jgi:benzylsuccinate CoA-transferase BbsE subunit
VGTDEAASSAGPLAGITVIEIADDPAGELTGLRLAELGAEVVKVEPPEGAPSRHVGPYADGQEGPETSLTYWYYNSSKRSVVLDLHTSAGRAHLDAMLATADVFVSALHPIELRTLGLDLNELIDTHERLVVVSITPFGLTGEWADYRSSDLVGLAASGLLNTSGYDDHSIPPIRPGGGQGYHSAASFAEIGAALALVARDQTGRGDLIDVAMHDSCAVTCELANPYYFYPKALVQRQTCRHAQPSPTQPALFRCADGYIYFALILADTKPWNSMVSWLDSKGLAADLTDPAYDDVAHRQAQFPHVQGVLEVFFLLQNASDLYHEGQERSLPVGVVNAPEDVLNDEHMRERGFFVPLDHGYWKDVPHPGLPLGLSGYDPLLRPAPTLGADTEAVLAEVGQTQGGQP